MGVSCSQLDLGLFQALKQNVCHPLISGVDRLKEVKIHKTLNYSNNVSSFVADRDRMISNREHNIYFENDTTKVS